MFPMNEISAFLSASEIAGSLEPPLRFALTAAEFWPQSIVFKAANMPSPHVDIILPLVVQRPSIGNAALPVMFTAMFPRIEEKASSSVPL